MKVYSNTTPFIALCSVNLLHLLPALFSQINVATSVAQECHEGGKIGVPDLSSLPWIHVQDVPSSQQLPALFELDRGERDTLLLAAQQPGALVLMDEKLGRNMAEYMGLGVTGTLGILAKAKSLGLIPSFVQAATGMRAQGIYFSEGLVNRIATRLGELN
jgi:predicted nucleic acid-binding protein